MQFEQYQEEDGKNIINITVEKDDSEALKKDAENFIDGKGTQISSTSLTSSDTSIIPEKTEIKKVEKPLPLGGVGVGQNKDSEIEDKYKKYQYLLLGGIVFTFILLIILIILYKKGF